MPSPVGHALAGMAMGSLVAPSVRHGAWQTRLALAAAGMAADLDLLMVGAHRGPTHSVGAVVLVAVVCAVVARQRGVRAPLRWGLAFGAAYATHIGLDWLGTDSSPPIGVMALWPFGRDYYESDLHVFMAISRRYWLPEFVGHNLRALARELAILLPLAAMVLQLRRPSTRA